MEGAVANPINILCQMISKLHDEDNKIAIPGFYDNVEIISDKKEKKWLKLLFLLKIIKKH